MKYLFTKSFFRLSELDQAAVVNAYLQELESQNWANKESEQRAKKRARLIRKRAEELGLLSPAMD